MRAFFLVLALFLCQFSFFQSFKIKKNEVLRIVENHTHELDTIQQLLLVINDNDTSHTAILVALEKNNNKWKLKFNSMLASIGRNGFALPGKKIEGDGKSPTGLYALGQLFSY